MFVQSVDSGQGLHLLLISVHGLIRSEQLELGRDPDTGGQVLYVVELARALARRDDVSRVDLVTRLIESPDIDDDYAQAEESLGVEGARILRIEAGPRDYLPKEQLWDHLDSFTDNLVDKLLSDGTRPDLIHSHYADAGYVGSRLSGLLGVPLVHTGHSLGRVKRRRLLASGLKPDVVEERYNIARRIDAEEDTLAAADMVIASTSNEIEDQYERYDHYAPERMVVVPPGTDLERFSPPEPNDSRFDSAPIVTDIQRFLRNPDLPVILAIARPDERKNLVSLVDAFGESKELRERANLVVVAGNRDDISDLDRGAESVLTDILLAVDRHDLYGSVAYPKHHLSDDVPLLYRYAAASGGVFVNPALTEPFGLTLIEAAACGVPIVATEDGGPQDIVANLENGLLIDPLDTEAIASALLDLIGDRDNWQAKASSGLMRIRQHYSWEAHVEAYLDKVKPLLQEPERVPKSDTQRRPILHQDRALFSDLDQNLAGNPASIPGFVKLLKENRRCVVFGVATGRRRDAALRLMRRFGIPQPDVLITSGGSEIAYAPELEPDQAWARHIDHLWKPKSVREALADFPGLKPQPKSEQSRFKISYYIDPDKAPSIEEINQALRKEEIAANTVFSFGQYLDVLPIRASKGMALRWFAAQWGMDLNKVMVAGGSGADEDMMRGNTLAVVVSNRHHEELSELTDQERIYFAKQSHADGIVEAIQHYQFFEACRAPAA
ncbi:MAG: HAD-IIB family hydrolase [Gammaproteobacteria bacterium]